MSIQPPEEPPSGMGTIIQHLYDAINRLADEQSSRRAIERRGEQQVFSGGTSIIQQGSALDGLETTVQGVVPPDRLLLRHVATQAFTLSGIVLDARTPGASPLAVFVRRIDREARTTLSTDTVVLPAGAYAEEAPLNREVTSSMLVEVWTDVPEGQWTDTLSTLTINLAVA